MEEELNYVAVMTFKTNGTSSHEKPNNLEIIYDEVKTEERTRDTSPVISAGNEKKPPSCTLLHLVAAGLGIICIILASAVIALTIHFNTVMSEQHRENTNLTAQNLQLWAAMTDLERQTQELIREKDGLNWTIGVIMDYETFPVKTHCPHKVCKPCLDDWVLFRSNCYFFSKFDYSYFWRTWEGSSNECRNMNADLVVIESQEEQEFINNHTNPYNDENHGYWIGLNKKDMTDTWTWVDGSNFTVEYWRTQYVSSRKSCALTLPGADPVANWQKTSCDMKNRWICETRALIKPEEESAPSSK